MYKALITDLDGTAVPVSSNGSDIPESTRQAVSRALAQDKKIACATGREWPLAKPVVDRLGITSPCIIEGGTRIIDPISEETIWEKTFDEHEPARILEILKSVTKQGLLMDSNETNHRPLEQVAHVPEKLHFIYLLNIPSPVADEISQRIALETNAVAHYTPSWFGNDMVDIHITHSEATKQHAIEVWQKLHDITKEETIGMGDSGNDIPIFESSGYKVAVDNATSNLKNFADLVTVPVSENALEYIILEKLLKET